MYICPVHFTVKLHPIRQVSVNRNVKAHLYSEISVILYNFSHIWTGNLLIQRPQRALLIIQTCSRPSPSPDQHLTLTLVAFASSGSKPHKLFDRGIIGPRIDQYFSGGQWGQLDEVQQGVSKPQLAPRREKPRIPVSEMNDNCSNRQGVEGGGKEDP